MATKTTSPDATLRLAIGAHVIAVGVCVLFSRLDSMAAMPPEGPLTRVAIGVSFLAALLAWLVCPVTVLVAAGRVCSTRQAAYAILTEFILCIAQGVALLPAVS